MTGLHIPDDGIGPTSDHMPDQKRLLDELRQLRRGDLLIIAERAIEQLPAARLSVLLGDFVALGPITGANSAPVPLLAAVEAFCAASRAGHYFEPMPINAGHLGARSRGTDAFIAEFDRLLRWCLRVAERGNGNEARPAFEQLFALLRRLDECVDEILFFADEGGSWEVGVNWRAVLPVYFRCLAETEAPSGFARIVDDVIRSFANHDRHHLLDAARAVAGVEQCAALDALAPVTG